MKVKFIIKPDRYEVRVSRTSYLKPYRRSKHDPSYRHPKDAPSSEEALTKALRAARKLREEVKRFVLEDAKKPPAPYALLASRRVGPRIWLIDTGAGFDLVSADDIDPEYLEKARRILKETVVLRTANSTVEVDSCIELRLKRLAEVIEPLLLDDTPPVFSCGKHCREDGYGFYWAPWAKRPILWTPKGEQIRLQVHENVPYLDDDAKIDKVSPAAVAKALRLVSDLTLSLIHI